MAKRKAPKTDEPVQLWKKRITSSETNQQKFLDKAQAWYDLLHARVEEGDFAWHSQYFDPILASKSWSLLSKIVAGGSGWMVTATGETPEENAKAMEEALAYFERNPELDEKMFEKYAIAGIDTIVTGIAYMKVPWTIKKKIVYERVMDEAGNFTLDAEGDLQQKKTEFFLKYPDALNWSLGDLLYSPAVNYSAIQKSPYLIFRSYVPKSELKKINAANGGKFYQNLDAIPSKSVDFDAFTKARNRVIGKEVDPTIDMVEIHECWEKDFDEETGAECVYVTTIANRSVLIQERRKSPFWHGKYPIAQFKIKPRGGSVEGEGIFETNERGQWAINDLSNHFMDAWNLANNPMILQEEQTVVDSYEVAPGNSILYRGVQEPKPFQFPLPAIQAYDGIYQRLLASVETNSISGYQAGTPSDASDQTQGTMGGIKAIQQAGDDLISFYRQIFRNGVQELGILWMQMIQQFLDESIWVEITGENGKERIEITPQMVQGQFTLDLDETALQSPNKERDRAIFDAYVDRITLIQEKALAQGTPLAVDWVSVIKDLGEKYGIANADKYVTEMQPQQMIPPGMPQEPGFMPPEMPMQEPMMPPEMPPAPQLVPPPPPF
jgi:hypothetical protein